MKIIRGFVALSLLIAVVMAIMVMGAAEDAAMNGQGLSRKLFYGPLYPLGFGIALVLLHQYLLSPSGQRWRKYRNERSCARRVAKRAYVQGPVYPE